MQKSSIVKSDFRQNAILIVVFAKVRRDAGLPAAEAAVTAARLRFRAVMMTALSFILGVLPLVFASGAGAVSRTSIGYVVLSGMVAATVVGVVFVPVLYWVVERVGGGRGRPGGAAGRGGRFGLTAGWRWIRGSAQGAARAVRRAAVYEAPARGETGRLPEYVLIGGDEVRPMIGPRPPVEAS